MARFIVGTLLLLGLLAVAVGAGPSGRQQAQRKQQAGGARQTAGRARRHAAAGEEVEQLHQRQLYDQLVLANSLLRMLEQGEAGALDGVPPTAQALMALPTAFAAFTMCGAMFSTGLPFEVAFEVDCDIACLFSNVTVDYDERSLVASVRGTGAWPTKAFFRGEGLGCTVVDGLTEAEIRAQDVGDQTPLPPLNATEPWPLGDAVDIEGDRDPDVDWEAVDAAVDADMANPDFNTRAIVIVHRGRVVLERYAPGIDAASRLLGYSASKSVTSALIGHLVGEGRVNVTAPAPVPEWYETDDDPRAAVTVQNLLHFESGQPWGVFPGDLFCIFLRGAGDCAGFYARLPQEVPPGTRHLYCSGGTMLLMRIVLQQRGEPELTNFEWPRQKFFRHLSMNSAIIESQANTYQLGGAAAYLCARDWARFGYLYLRDGVWLDGQRYLPEGWVDYTRTPSLTNPSWGAHLLLRNTPTPGILYTEGFRNQNTFIIKNRDLVVTRMAMPPLLPVVPWNLEAFLASIVNAFPEVPSP